MGFIGYEVELVPIVSGELFRIIVRSLQGFKVIVKSVQGYSRVCVELLYCRVLFCCHNWSEVRTLQSCDWLENNRHPRQLLVQENRTLDPTLLGELVKKCQSECLQLLALELKIQEHAQAQLRIVIVCVPTCRLCLRDQVLFVRMVSKIFV